MVTYTKTMVKDKLALFSFSGKSSDTKPTGEVSGIQIGNGSSFLEIDTQDIKFYDGDTDSWV